MIHQYKKPQNRFNKKREFFCIFPMYDKNKFLENYTLHKYSRIELQKKTSKQAISK